MIKPKTFIILLVLFIAGVWHWLQHTPDRFDLKAHLHKYNRLKQQIKHQHDSLQTNYKAHKTQQTKLITASKTYLHRTLSQQIFPYWYGTRWNYHGTTNVPRKGKIACGYFVTTTLKHAGFKLNRYKFAQQAASVIIKRLCQPGSIKTIGQNDTEKLIK